MRRDGSLWHVNPTTLIRVGLLLMALAMIGYAARLWLRTSDLQSQVVTISQMVQPGGKVDLIQARTAVKAIRFDLIELRNDVAWALPFLTGLSWVPEWGGDLSQGEPLLNIALDVSSAADHWLDGVAATADGDPAVSFLERGIEALEQNREQFARARSYLARAEMSRAQVKPAALSPRTGALVGQLDRVLPLAQLCVDGALVAPELLGASTQRRYLIVAQNEDELRATGGFVSAAGLLSIERGRIVDLSFMDSYQVDDLEKEYPKPPDALERIMRAGMLLFRDSNWSPDFPTSAEMLADLYTAGQGRPVNGVIALDQEALRLLVRPVAPLKVAGDPPASVTTENLIGYMRESWAPPTGATPDAAWLARKNFVGNLAQAFLQRLTTDEQLNSGALARSAYDALQGRHILVWLRDSPLQGSLARTRWDGALRTGDGDFVMVVDSNVGFNKANALVSQQFQMQTTLSADLGVRSALSITYHHAGKSVVVPCRHYVPDYSLTLTYQALIDSCYWDYVRIMVPKGTALRAATRIPIPGTQLLSREDSTGEPEVLSGEERADAFATFFFLERGGTRDVSFTFDPPPGAVVEMPDGAWQYRSRWQKQAGTPAIPAKLAISLPAGSVLLGTFTSAPARVSHDSAGGTVRVVVEFALATDLEVAVRFRRP